MLEIHTKQWWVENLAPILKGSKFEAKINPCENENCVIVILKEEYKEHKKKKDHYLAVKPYVKGGFATWMKMDVYVNANKIYNIPEPSRIHNNMPHFNNFNDENMIFNIVKFLAEHM